MHKHGDGFLKVKWNRVEKATFRQRAVYKAVSENNSFSHKKYSFVTAPSIENLTVFYSVTNLDLFNLYINNEILIIISTNAVKLSSYERLKNPREHINCFSLFSPRLTFAVLGGLTKGARPECAFIEAVTIATKPTTSPFLIFDYLQIKKKTLKSS